MKVLVTGSTGFVGSAIVRALRWHGHAVLGLVRDPAKGRKLARQGVQVAVGDMLRPDTYEPLVSQVDAVVHAAQLPLVGRWTPAKITALHDADALMTRTLAGACLAQDKPLLYTSGGLTHCCDGDAWINECSPPNPCRVAVGHAAQVQWLGDMHQQHGLRSMVLSPGLVYGAGGFFKMTVEMLLRRRYCHLGNPDNFWSLAHIDDVGEAYALALEKGRPGESYFIADDLPLRREEVIGRMAQALGLPQVRRMPGWLAKLALGGPLLETIGSPLRMRNKKARRELGWQPRYGCFPAALSGVLRELLDRLPALKGCVARLHSA